MFHYLQRTVAKPVHCTGIGMHSGKTVDLIIAPAPGNHGIKFSRTDLPESPSVTAHFHNVVDTSLATVIGHNGFIISTIEHLMACFAAFGIDNAAVSLNSYEMPIMDGSAAPFVDLIKTAGIVDQDKPRCYFVVTEAIELEQNEKFIGLYPAPQFEITYSIDYDHPLIGHQTCSLSFSEPVFETDVSRARSFGFIHEYEQLKQLGFSKGASLENVVVLDTDQVMNPDGLRYPDEMVRHKMLDCIGDFSLLGMPILGKIVARKSGHAFHYEFLKKFFSNKNAWETQVLTQCPYESASELKSLAI
ncbi:MAG: UDP-3-O-acyl-N-acetylglucosamine deacetylase [Deltaproteobacteria bacterium]|nr:UDP-3-O-acyl-N-acetylglucosamine deacetylase [Deltaproteobacteria bacterium]